MKEIVEQNIKRKNKLFAHYDPLKGEGSPIDRFEFPVNNHHSVFLPESMRHEPIVRASLDKGSLKQFLEGVHDNRTHIEDNYTDFCKLRIRHDFEFWAALCATIRDRKAQPVRFILNHAQRKFFPVLETMRLAGVPIRVILLKARQWGGSTLLRLYMGWIQLFLKTGWGSAIISTVENQALHIRGMFDTVATHHPPEVFDIQFKPYKGSTKNREIVGRDCVVGIGSYEDPENLRGFTFQMIHFSECASWGETASKTPENLTQSLRSTVPRTDLSLIALESTAKGVGNFFHREWVKAERGESGYKPVFIPFFDIEEYFVPIKENNYISFAESMSPKEWELWGLGATLESILWRRSFKRGENFSDEAMSEEYPGSSHEAFVSSGRRVFPYKYTQRLRQSCCDPEFKGELRGKERSGQGSLEKLEFHEQPGGNLWVWTKPDTSMQMAHRYVVFVDIGGRHHKSDKSVIRVMDRFWMSQGEKPEFVATWRGNIDQDILAWIATQVASWYCDALLIIEDNSLDKEDDGSGHFYTILDEIAEHYDNLYSRTDPDKIRQGAPVRYGFITNRKTKNMIIDALHAAARDDEYIERDARAVDEMDTFEEKDRGRMGAQEGCYDDMVITSAGCVWAATKDMEPPYEVKEYKSTTTKKIVGEASM